MPLAPMPPFCFPMSIDSPKTKKNAMNAMMPHEYCYAFTEERCRRADVDYAQLKSLSLLRIDGQVSVSSL